MVQNPMIESPAILFVTAAGECVCFFFFGGGNFMMAKNQDASHGSVTLLIGSLAYSPWLFWEGEQMDTPWKINMDHDHGGLEDHFPF